MLARGHGRMIELRSIAGGGSVPGFFAYSVSEAGVRMMTKVMAMELAGKGMAVHCAQASDKSSESSFRFDFITP